MHVDPLKFRVPLGRCECGEPLDAATPADHDCSPQPGDVTVCIYCARVLSFNAELMIVPLTTEQIAELPPDIQTELRKVALAVYRLHKS